MAENRKQLAAAFENSGCVMGKKDPVQGIRRCPECNELLTASSTANLVRVLHTHLGEAHPDVVYRY